MNFIKITLLCLIAASSFAQEQIAKYKSGNGLAHFSRGFIIYKDQILFASAHDFYGAELWVTDGTVGSARLVKDINLGNGSSVIASTHNRKRKHRIFGITAKLIERGFIHEHPCGVTWKTLRKISSEHY